ncbi:hypothetical protein Tco_0488710 [Tanacetum coccineum]
MRSPCSKQEFSSAKISESEVAQRQIGLERWISNGNGYVSVRVNTFKKKAGKKISLIRKKNSSEIFINQDQDLGKRMRILKLYNSYTLENWKEHESGNDEAEIAKKDLQTKLDNHLAKTEKWTSSSKNLLRLIDSSMSVRTKVGLGFNDYIGENELGWDDSAFSVLTTT